MSVTSDGTQISPYNLPVLTQVILLLYYYISNYHHCFPGFYAGAQFSMALCSGSQSSTVDQEYCTSSVVKNVHSNLIGCGRYFGILIPDYQSLTGC